MIIRAGLAEPIAVRGVWEPGQVVGLCCPALVRFWPKAAVTGIHLGQQLSGDKPPSMLMITRSKAAALREAEQDKLATAEHENCLGLMQHDEVRPRHLGDTIKSLQSPIGRLNV